MLKLSNGQCQGSLRLVLVSLLPDVPAQMSYVLIIFMLLCIMLCLFIDANGSLSHCSFQVTLT